jgi:hypothetical protein
MALRGIEKVDAQALAAQRSLTEALWLTLEGQGLKNRTAGRIECFFGANSDTVAAALVNAFPAEWDREVSPRDGVFSVKITTPLVHLSRDAFLELVDVMMIAADEAGCVFDGFQVDWSGLQRRPRRKRSPAHFRRSEASETNPERQPLRRPLSRF